MSFFYMLSSLQSGFHHFLIFGLREQTFIDLSEQNRNLCLYENDLVLANRLQGIILVS